MSKFDNFLKNNRPLNKKEIDTNLMYKIQDKLEKPKKEEVSIMMPIASLSLILCFLFLINIKPKTEVITESQIYDALTYTEEFVDYDPFLED